MDAKNVFVAVHAGAGTHAKANEAAYKATCKTACQQAMTLLKSRKSAMDAVLAALTALEDAECTNAGQGSNLTMEGTVECDACLMDGKTLHFGAVGALSGVQNPVKVAHKLADEQKLGQLPCGRVRPSILVGIGAQDYCTEHGIDIKRNLVSKAAFKTYNRYKRKCQLAELAVSQPKKTKSEIVDPDCLKEGKLSLRESQELTCPVQDTVGAICVDYEGNVASAASSGGIWLKHSGRLGPAAVYGAGCWAQNQISESKAGVAAVTSGCGEHLIQTLLAKTCCDATRCTEDFSSSVAAAFQNEFLDSEFLRSSNNKFGGSLILRTQLLESEREVELSWIHSTASMCLAYMDGKKTSPTATISRLDERVVPGQSYTMGGHVSILR